MKKLLFFVLILAICAAAFFAKPQDPKASLANYLKEHQDSFDKVLPAEYVGPKDEWIAGRFEYKDHILWTDAKTQSGQTVYTCIFAHWINRAELKEAMKDDVKTLKDKMDKAADKATEKLSKPA